MTASELAIYDAMPEDPPVSEYEQGVRDGIESAVRRFSRLRFNPSSQHIHPANETHPSQTCYLRIDHIDETLIQMLDSVVTEGREG